MMGILVLETCWAYKKYNKIISSIWLVFIPQWLKEFSGFSKMLSRVTTFGMKVVPSICRDMFLFIHVPDEQSRSNTASETSDVTTWICEIWGSHSGSVEDSSLVFRGILML